MQTSFTNQPVVVVRKITYYEPELVAVVVEKGVDDIPEETYMIQNYADVLAASNNEIHLCDAHDTKQCMDTPVTKLLVPSLFKSIGQTGFENFFKEAKEVPWVSTINNNVELVKPIIAPKASAVSETPLKIVSPDIFRYIPDTVLPTTLGVNEYRTYPVQSSDVLRNVNVPVQHDIPQTRVVSGVFPANLAAGFAPLERITTGGSILGAPTVRTAYQPSQFYNSHYVQKRQIQF